LFYSVQGQNIYFYLQKNGFYRLYYFINQPELLYTTIASHTPIVLEILYRGEKHFPKAHLDFWLQSGFELHLSRDCYFLKNNDVNLSQEHTSIEIKNAQTMGEYTYVKNLIDQDLDLYTGDNLSIEEIEIFAKKGLVYVAYADTVPCGFLQADFKNNIFWLGHIVVDTCHRGKGIAKFLINHYLNEGMRKQCTQFQLWVIQDNLAAVSLYKKYGFVYLNKSTCSMLKK
jgi:GNAT superfamily N-acetyltransferase